MWRERDIICKRGSGIMRERVWDNDRKRTRDRVIVSDSVCERERKYGSDSEREFM